MNDVPLPEPEKRRDFNVAVDAVGNLASGLGDLAGAVGELSGGCGGCSLVVLAAFILTISGGAVYAWS